MDGLFKPPIFSMGIHSVPTYMDYLYSWIGQVTKIVLGEGKWKPVVKKFCARPRWFLELHTHSYRSICRRIYRIKYVFFKFPWNLFPAWEEAAKYSKRNCNNRRMFCEVGEPLGTLRYQDGELRQGRHCKSKTGMSPVVAAKNKILKIVYFCVGRRRRYFSLYNSNDIL